jgi:hypothetical protein
MATSTQIVMAVLQCNEAILGVGIQQPAFNDCYSAAVCYQVSITPASCSPSLEIESRETTWTPELPLVDNSPGSLRVIHSVCRFRESSSTSQLNASLAVKAVVAFDKIIRPICAFPCASQIEINRLVQSPPLIHTIIIIA